MKIKKKIIICVAVIIAVVVFFLLAFFVIKNKNPTPSDFKIAFLGDQQIGGITVDVLNLIKREKTDMVLDLGDFNYAYDPEGWEDQISQILGADFPYLAVVGNHDVEKFSEYQEKMKKRMALIPELMCEGEIGTDFSCIYKGILFALSGVGTKDSGNSAARLREHLKTKAVWKICGWHKNQQLMQTRGKSDETGWEVYEVCRQAGAMIATAHAHSYSRTHLMSDFEHQEIASDQNTLTLKKGQSFAFVSALGGSGVRPMLMDNHLAENPWWASVYTGGYGALFCTFNENKIRNHARCYFKNTDGEIIDEFNLVSELNQNS